MKTEELKQRLHDYIDSAEDKKLEAIYTVLESDIEGAVYDWTKDEEWLAELKRRGADLKSGKVKGLTWDEVKKRTMDAIEQRKVKAYVPIDIFARN